MYIYSCIYMYIYIKCGRRYTPPSCRKNLDEFNSISRSLSYYFRGSRSRCPTCPSDSTLEFPIIKTTKLGVEARLGTRAKRCIL